MANKKTTGPESPVTAEQQTGSPGAEAPKVFTIEQLRDEKKVKRARAKASRNASFTKAVTAYQSNIAAPDKSAPKVDARG